MADDRPDGIQNFVFDEHNNKRAPWKCCSQTSVPRCEVVFFVQVTVIVLIIILCFSMLFFTAGSCEEKSIWIALLSSLVGYVLPNPKL